MDASIIVSSPMLRLHDSPAAAAESNDTADLLRQMIELQREQIAIMRSQQAAADDKARWQNFYNRWAGDFPDLPGRCKGVLPAVERAFLELLQDLTHRLTGDEALDLESEFALGEFLDKYGVRLAQLGNILGQIGHLSNVTPPSDPTA